MPLNIIIGLFSLLLIIYAMISFFIADEVTSSFSPDVWYYWLAADWLAHCHYIIVAFITHTPCRCFHYAITLRVISPPTHCCHWWPFGPRFTSLTFRFLSAIIIDYHFAIAAILRHARPLTPCHWLMLSLRHASRHYWLSHYWLLLRRWHAWSAITSLLVAFVISLRLRLRRILAPSLLRLIGNIDCLITGWANSLTVIIIISHFRYAFFLWLIFLFWLAATPFRFDYLSTLVTH